MNDNNKINDIDNNNSDESCKHKIESSNDNNDESFKHEIESSNQPLKKRIKVHDKKDINQKEPVVEDELIDSNQNNMNNNQDEDEDELIHQEKKHNDDNDKTEKVDIIKTKIEYMKFSGVKSSRVGSDYQVVL